MPVFDGLLGVQHNSAVLNVLFTYATWHAYAKLRMHTTSTLAAFRGWTFKIGQTSRRFAKLSDKTWKTMELPHEASARAWREMAKATKQGPSQPRPSGTPKASQGIKSLNLKTYKFHSLAYYPSAIEKKGTTDGFTTQTVLLPKSLRVI